MDVSIFIDVYHTGHLKHGSGIYTIVLEYIKKTSEPVTREYIRGINKTTKNRTALIACIDAFKELTKMECYVTVTTNSEYITCPIISNDWFDWIYTGMNAKKKPVKNLELWQELFELVDKHHTKFEYAEKNSYTDWIKSESKRRTIEYKEDLNNV